MRLYEIETILATHLKKNFKYLFYLFIRDREQVGGAKGEGLSRRFYAEHGAHVGSTLQHRDHDLSVNQELGLH